MNNEEEYPLTGTLYWLPSDAIMRVVQFAPSPRVSYIQPAHERTVRRYLGTGNSGTFVKEKMQIPDLLYSFDVNGNAMKMNIVESVADGKIVCRAMMLANVHGGGNICWGHNEIPPDIRGKQNAYWESIFNDDLTPYPRVAQEAFPYVRRPHMARMSMMRYRMEDRGHQTPDGWMPGRTPPNPYLRASEAAARMHARLGSYIGDESSTDTLRWEYTRRRIMGEDVARHLERLTRLDIIAHGYYQRWQATNRRNENQKFQWSELVSDIRQAAQCVAWRLVYHQVGDTLRQREYTHTGRQWMRRLLSSLENYMTLYPRENRDLCMTYIRRELRYHARRSYIEVSSQHYQRSLLEYQQENMETVRKDWWSGGWTKYDRALDMKDWIFGRSFYADADGFDGVLSIGDQGRHTELRKTLGKMTDEVLGRRVYLPVWHHPHDPRKAFGMIGEQVVECVFTQQSGYAVEVRPFNPERAELLKKAEEIF